MDPHYAHGIVITKTINEINEIIFFFTLTKEPTTDSSDIEQFALCNFK